MRYAILFLLIGLGIGLGLGFNPAAHRDTVRWWNRVQRNERASTVPGALAANGNQLNRRLSRSLRPTSKLQPAAGSGTVPTAPQISTELQAFWNALQRIWLNITAQASGRR